MIRTVVTRGFGSFGSIALVVARGYQAGAVDPAVVVGGADYFVQRVKSKAKKKDNSVVEDLRKIYEELPKNEQIEIKQVVAQFSERKIARREIVPAAAIDFEKLSRSVSAVEALIKAYEEALNVEMEEEFEVELLLMAA